MFLCLGFLEARLLFFLPPAIPPSVRLAPAPDLMSASRDSDGPQRHSDTPGTARQHSLNAQKQKSTTPAARQKGLAMYQSLPPGILVSRARQGNDGRQVDRELLATVEMAPPDTRFRLKKQVKQILENQPTFNLQACRVPADAFLYVWRDMLPFIAQHGYLHSFKEDWTDADLVSEHDLIQKLTFDIHVWRQRSRASSSPVTNLDDAVKQPGPDVHQPRLDGLGFEDVPLRDVLCPYTKYLSNRSKYMTPAGLFETHISGKLRSLIICLDGTFVCVDEKKPTYHGHSNNVILIRGDPRLWATQAGVQCPNSDAPFLFGLRPHYDRDLPKSKKDELDWVLKLVDGNLCLYVFDSYYSSPEVMHMMISQDEKFMTSLNPQFYRELWSKFKAELVDEGDTSTARVPVDTLSDIYNDNEEQHPHKQTKEEKRQAKLDQLLAVLEATQAAIAELTQVDEPDQASAVTAPDNEEEDDSASPNAEDATSEADKQEAEKIAHARKIVDQMVNGSNDEPEQDRPFRLAGLPNGSVYVSAHWFTQINKKSKGMRVVASNAFKPCNVACYPSKKVKGKSGEENIKVTDRVAEINSAYGALFFLGSDLGNNIHYRVGEVEARRGPNDQHVLSHYCTETTIISLFAYFQHKGEYQTGGDSKVLGQQFLTFLDDLATGLAERFEEFSKEKIEPALSSNEPGWCPCIDCNRKDVPVQVEALKGFFATSAQWDADHKATVAKKEKAEREREEKRQAKEQKQKVLAEEKEQREVARAAKQAAKEEARAEKQARREARAEARKAKEAAKEEKKRQKDRTRKKKVETCRKCQQEFKKKVSVTCSSCFQVYCPTCSQLRGRAASTEKKSSWRCPNCPKQHRRSNSSSSSAQHPDERSPKRQRRVAEDLAPVVAPTVFRES